LVEQTLLSSGEFSRVLVRKQSVTGGRDMCKTEKGSNFWTVDMN